MNVEFCYSTVVTRANNSSSDAMKAVLTRLNMRAAYRETTVKVAVAVEFMMFGSPVRKPLDWIERLEAANMQYQIIYK